jgi:5'-nucleotidase
MPRDFKKILYIDMDNVIVDFASGIARLDAVLQAEFEGRLDEVPGIFALMEPMPGAIEAINVLAQKFDTYILSTAPWLNSTAWSDKIEWVHEHLGSSQGDPLYKRLILSHHKNLNIGDYLIDDRTANGVDKFKGEHIHFGTEKFPDWHSVFSYLLAEAR